MSRGDVCKLYCFRTPREHAGACSIFLHPQDPAAFVFAPTDDEAWAATAEFLHQLPDD